jgi:hypothetical protein
VEQMRNQMFRRILFCHREDMMRSRVRAKSVFMQQVGVGSDNANRCQNQAKSDDEERADTHIVMLAHLPTCCHWTCALWPCLQLIASWTREAPALAKQSAVYTPLSRIPSLPLRPNGTLRRAALL